MIERYINAQIETTWSDSEKLARWDQVELAVIATRVELGLVSETDYRTIKETLTLHPPDLKWWRAREKEVGHDLNAYIDERRRHLPPELQHLFHQDMTSYDTEEAAFARALLDSLQLVLGELYKMAPVMRLLAPRYRHTPMLDRTHGQWAKVRSFGSRVLTWVQELREAQRRIESALESCKRSRLSGAIGTYGNLTPEIERIALSNLGFEPFYGATQIMPRVVYAEPAQALYVLAEVLGKIALDIWLGARSGSPIYQEPFGKLQKGSSAMPHKRNPILTEQMEGMVRMARSRCLSIVSNIQTREARSIEQSSVERVEWPDLFHIVLRMISVMTKVLDGLVVYPDHMLEEIVASCGTYASEEAKNFLAKQLATRSIDAEIAYLIVQLASSNVSLPSENAEKMRHQHPGDLATADEFLRISSASVAAPRMHIRDLIKRGELFAVPNLKAMPKTVGEWNGTLLEIFSDPEVGSAWDNLFLPSNLMKEEEHLFRQIAP